MWSLVTNFDSFVRIEEIRYRHGEEDSRKPEEESGGQTKVECSLSVGALRAQFKNIVRSQPFQ